MAASSLSYYKNAEVVVTGDVTDCSYVRGQVLADCGIGTAYPTGCVCVCVCVCV